VEEQVAMLSQDDANRPWLARLSVNPNNTQFESLHGADAAGGARASTGEGTGFGTSFPHALAMAASLNKTLWRMVGRTIALETRAFVNQGVGGRDANSGGAGGPPGPLGLAIA
jgi:beta-glucosidase-like glycosyl hydrolase